jgi:hypothetical protein
MTIAVAVIVSTHGVQPPGLERYGRLARRTRRTLPPITRAITSSSRPASSSACVTWGRPARVEGHGHGAVEVRAERDVVGAGDPDRVGDRARDGVRVAAAHGGVPEADAHDAAGARRPRAAGRR